MLNTDLWKDITQHVLPEELTKSRLLSSISKVQMALKSL